MKLDVFDEKAFEEAGIDFYVVATNIETGQPDYLKIDNVFEQMEAFRASSALPVASRIVEWKGEKYLDGGLSDSIPVDFAKSLGFDKLIVILTQPRDYRKKQSSGRLYKLLYRKYPNFVKTASNRPQQYNAAVEHIQDLEDKGQLFAIRPQEKLQIGRLEKNPDKFEEIYHIGISDGEKAIADLKEYLG